MSTAISFSRQSRWAPFCGLATDSNVAPPSTPSNHVSNASPATARAACAPVAEDTSRKRRMRRLRQALRNADRHGVAVAVARALRRRLPGDDRYGDPLSVSGRAPAELLGARLALLAGESP